MLLLSLGACMEEQEDLSQVSKLPPQLAQVKQWFEANKEQLRIRDGGASFRTESQELIMPFFEKEPDWERVHQYSFADGRDVFEISLANAQKYFPAYLRDSLQTQDPAGAVIQNIMFVKNPETGSFDPLIARYYPDNETSIREFGDIHYNDIPLGWSGLVDIWTYDERFFVAFAIEDGEITRVFQRMPHEMDNGRKKLPTGQNYDVACQYYQVTYLAYTVTAAGLTTEHLEYGIVYECSGGSLPTGPTPVIYTFGPTSSPSGTYGGVGGTTPTYEKVNYTPPPVPAPNILMIFNNVIDPCLRAQVETSISEKFNSKIPRIVNSAFRTNEIFDVDIVDVDFLPSDQMGGATLSQSEDYCRATIELNANILRNSSKEYILATVYHELLHAYLDYLDAETNYDNTQHEIMANNYVSIMASDLQENFGLSGKEANALAWGGLHETTAWQSVTNKNYILEVNQKHKNGTTGTKCN